MFEINALNDYVICLYYVCKEIIHDKYINVCEVTGERNGYSRSNCNCLTEKECNNISDFFKSYIQDTFDTSDEYGDEDNTCMPVYRSKEKLYEFCNSAFFSPNEETVKCVFSIEGQSLSSVNRMQKINKLKDGRRKLDVFVCCAALTNNDNLKQIADILYYAPESNIVSELNNLLDLDEFLQSKFLENKYYPFLCILKSCKILNKIKDKQQEFDYVYNFFSIISPTREFSEVSNPMDVL